MIIGLALLTVLGGCSTHQVFRGARVPRPAPTPRSGVPVGNALEVGLTGSTLAEFLDPELGDSSAGVHIPRHQGRADLRMGPSSLPDFDVGLVYERGLDAGSHALAKGSPEPEGAPSGLGISLHHSVDWPDPRFRTGLGLELLFYSVPWVEYRVCETNCGGDAFTIEENGVSVHPVAAIAMAQSFQLSPDWAAFASFTVRNHPTIERTGVEVGTDVGDDVQSGPFNVTVAGGAEYTHPATGIRASVLLYQTVTTDPVQYGPVVAASISVPLLRFVSAPAPSAQPPDPPVDPAAGPAAAPTYPPQ